MTLRPAVLASLTIVALACDGPGASLGEPLVPTPTLFLPGLVSTVESREYGIAFTPDAREAYFTRRQGRGRGQILVTRYAGGAWSEPEPAPFSVSGDEAPFITPDGTRLVFSSRRTMPGTFDRSDNLWVTERRHGWWTEPTPIAGSVNRPRVEHEDEDDSTGDESGAVVLPDGSLLYWAELDPEWGSDLYVARRDDQGRYVDPEPLRLNSYGDESSAVLSPDGRWLIFQAYRDAAGLGGQDLYASERNEHGWSEPVPLPEPINSERGEGYPSFSPDGRYFFFASDRDARGGYYAIYYVEVAALGLPGLGG